jgi:hypothetical protein
MLEVVSRVPHGFATPAFGGANHGFLRTSQIASLIPKDIHDSPLFCLTSDSETM